MAPGSNLVERQMKQITSLIPHPLQPLAVSYQLDKR